MDLQIHPIVKDLFPTMSAEDFRALCRDIRANGLRDDIILYEGMILDGDHRNQACQIENVPARFANYGGMDPLGFAVSKNLHRRHLTVQDRKRIATRLLKENPTLTDNELAKRSGLGSHNTAAKVRRDAQGSSNGQSDNREASPDEPHPLEFSTEPAPAPVSPRQEASGRKARGRKPGTTVAKEQKEVKPKSAAPKTREEWLFAGSALFEADPQQHGDDLVSIFVNCSEDLREVVKESTRQEWLEKIAVALGFRFTQAADA